MNHADEIQTALGSLLRAQGVEVGDDPLAELLGLDESETGGFYEAIAEDLKEGGA